MGLSELLVPGASILVAIIALLGTVIAANKRKEPTTAEVWAENSSLRDRLDRQDEKIEDQDGRIAALRSELNEQKMTAEQYRIGAERQITILGSGFDVLYSVLRTEELTAIDRATVDEARALRTITGGIPKPVVN